MRNRTPILIKGLVGLFAFPVFTVLTVGLTVCAVIMTGAGILRTFGADIQMNMLLLKIPRLLSLPVALVFSVLFLGLALASWKGLRFAYKFVAK